MVSNLAIVIPYYKLSFFKETLQSLADQTDKRFKVYIGDDASPENPSNLLKKYEGKFDFVYKRFDNNLGANSLTKHWERCIKMMEDEEWFMIFGDDDVLGTNAVALFYSNLEEVKNYDSKVIRFNHLRINEMGHTISKVFTIPKLFDPVAHIIAKFNGAIMTSLSQYILNYRAFEKVKIIDLPLAWGSDDLLIFELSRGKPIFSLEETVKVRISEFNITGKKNLDIIKNKALLVLFNYLISSNQFKEPKDINFLADAYFNHILLFNGTRKDLINFFSVAFMRISWPMKIYFMKATIKNFQKYK